MRRSVWRVLASRCRSRANRSAGSCDSSGVGFVAYRVAAQATNWPTTDIDHGGCAETGHDSSCRRSPRVVRGHARRRAKSRFDVICFMVGRSGSQKNLLIHFFCGTHVYDAVRRRKGPIMRRQKRVKRVRRGGLSSSRARSICKLNERISISRTRFPTLIRLRPSI